MSNHSVVDMAQLEEELFENDEFYNHLPEYLNSPSVLHRPVDNVLKAEMIFDVDAPLISAVVDLDISKDSCTDNQDCGKVDLDITRSSRDSSSDSQFINFSGVIQDFHRESLELEYNHLRSRYDGFTLLRHQEESFQFHTDQSRLENEEAAYLVSELMKVYNGTYSQRSTELMDNSSGETSVPRDYKTVIQTHLVAYLDRRDTLFGSSLSVNMQFPYHSVDAAVMTACDILNSESESEEKCKSYLTGYFEAICRLPKQGMTNQGKIFMESASLPLGRHPFGRCFSSVMVSLSMILSKVAVESFNKGTFIEILKLFISLSILVWQDSWPSFKTSSGSEILEECMHFVCFTVLHERIMSALYSAPMLDSFPTPRALSVLEMANPDRISSLIETCDVPKKYTTLIMDHIADHSTIPFLGVIEELGILSTCRSPVETATVLVSVLQHISRICGLLDGLEAGQKANLPADEMTPLLAFCVSLHFSIAPDNSSQLLLKDRSQMETLLCFTEDFLPDHLAMRQEAFATAVASTALQAVPIS